MARKDRKRSLCKVCKKKIVEPFGPKKAPGLIIGEFPGKEEMKKGKPFIGTAGNIFKTELRRAGLSFFDFRVTNVWLHIPNDNEFCLDWCFKKAVREARGRAAVLLVGSEATGMFLGSGVIDITGLKIRKCEYIDAPFIMAMPNPALALHASVGEIRFGLQQFKKGYDRHVSKTRV